MRFSQDPLDHNAVSLREFSQVNRVRIGRRRPSSLDQNRPSISELKRRYNMHTWDSVIATSHDHKLVVEIEDTSGCRTAVVQGIGTGCGLQIHGGQLQASF
jgi:hypothetical protein